MLAALVIWTYLTFIFLIYSVGTIVFLGRLLRLQSARPVSVNTLVLLGLIVVAWLSSLLSLIVKTGLLAHLLVLTGAFLILFFQAREVRNKVQSAFHHRHWTVWLLMLFALLATLLYAVKTPSNPDTTLYHAQAIHWIESYPAVPGLGNLEPRLGSNSNWFTLNALFSFSFLGLRSLHLIPSFLFLVAVFYFLGGLQSILSGDIRLSQVAKLAFVPFAFCVLIDEISSPGTDLPVLLFYWVILCLWLESVEENGSSILRVVVFLFSVFVITFKLSGIMVLLIALQIMWELWRRKEYRLLPVYAGLAVIALIPWLTRTFILTGYWLYPEPLMRFFSPHVDWRMSVERVLSFKQGVQAWALSPGTSWDEVSGFSLQQKLRFWFLHLTLNQRSIIVTALLSPVLFGSFSLVSRQKEKTIPYFPIVTIAFAGFLFWLLLAPNIRFGYGFALGVIVIAFAPLVQLALERLVHSQIYLIAAVVLVLFVQQVYVILGSTRDGTRYNDYLTLPADYAHVPTDACDLNGTTIFCAYRLRQCSYAAFPCVPQIQKNVVLRGKTFSDGFRTIATEP